MIVSLSHPHAQKGMSVSSPVSVWTSESRADLGGPTIAPKPAWAGPMLRGGLLGIVVAAVPVIIAGSFSGGALAALTAFAATIVVGAFFGVGQLVEAFALRMTDFRGFGLVLLSYTVRIALLGGVLLAMLSRPDLLARLPLDWFAWGAVAAVVGWLGGFLLAHARQRIPIYDEPRAKDA